MDFCSSGCFVLTRLRVLVCGSVPDLVLFNEVCDFFFSVDIRTPCPLGSLSIMFILRIYLNWRM